MKMWNWTRVWLIAGIVVSGTILLSQNKSSQAEDTKTEKKADAAKAEGTEGGEKPAAAKIDIAPEKGYGTVVGQFLLKGAIPRLQPAATPDAPNGGDIKTCGGTVVPNEKLVVDPKTKGIANIFVYLQKAPAKIHPNLVKPADPIVVFDQKICQFIPRALLVRVGQTVKVLSADPVAHNTHTHPLRNPESNSAVPPNDRKGSNNIKFSVVEKLPVSVGCDIHRWMLSWWLVLDHPYAAITDAEGKFAIGKLPAGDYVFTVWHESVGYIARDFKVTIPDNDTMDKKQIEVDVAKFKL